VNDRAAANGSKGDRSNAGERFVFCVDDDMEFLKSLEVMLPERINGGGGSGPWYRFLFFGDPGEALQTLKDLVSEGETVAMIISDQKMPNIKGTELLAQARQTSAGSVRVLLTGYAGIESAVQAINERLLDKYLTKPIEDDDGFALSIRHLLKGFEMQETIQEQSKAIEALYEFANRLNDIEETGETLRAIADFTARTLRCSQAFVLVRDAAGNAQSAAVGLAGDVGRWLSLPPVAVREAPSGDGEIQLLRNPDELLGQIFDVEEGIRQAPQFPLLLATLAADGEALGLIGAGGPVSTSQWGDGARRTLSYITNTASIALRKGRNRDRLLEAYSTIRSDAVRLADANSRLRLLDEMRAEFLAFISHELATPLSMMSALAMLDQSKTGNEQARLVEVAQHGYERLSILAKQALSYFAWLSRDPEWSADVTDLGDVITEALEGCAPPTAGRVEFLRPAEACRARIPAAPAAQIVKVLLDNAIKFSEEPSKIRVCLECRGDAIRLSVTDQGRGFPSEWSREIFRPFTVPDTLHHKRGSGLNVATAAVIAQVFHGSMEAESSGLGAGARFVVCLPSDRAPVAEAGSQPRPVTIG